MSRNRDGKVSEPPREHQQEHPREDPIDQHHKDKEQALPEDESIRT